MIQFKIIACFATLFVSAVLSGESPSLIELTASSMPETVKVPLGLPPIPWPQDNLYDPKKAELGRLLYFDKRISSDGTISCASCHAVNRGFSDGRPLSIGINGHVGTRHSPTVINSAYQKLYFWDGRANSLEDQAKGPIANPKEMTNVYDIHDAHRQCEERIRSIKGYCALFKEVYGNEECSIDQIAKAIATFERTILSGNSAYDKYRAGDKTALTQEQVHGYLLFKKVGCNNCHLEPIFTDGRYQNIGVGMDKPNPDLGRYGITKNEKDWGAFQTPTLREVAHTAPYMHDGSLKTLREVVDYYDKGGTPNKNLHPLVKPLHLSEQDKKDLVSFMEALSGEGWQHFKEPTEFPQ